jgi:hypothetical protein
MQYPGTLALPRFFPYVLAKYFLIFETKNIDRDPGFVSAHTNLKKLPTFSIGIFYGVKSISNRGVGNRLILGVFTIEEP